MDGTVFSIIGSAADHPSDGRVQEWAARFFLAAGVGARLWQYAANPSLYLDELAVARNILDRPLGRLLAEPLAYDQVAPAGFLLGEKLVVLALGGGERALRLLPLGAGIAALGLFYALAGRVLRGWGWPVAVALFALAVPLVRDGTQVKQYSLDVVAMIVVLTAAVGWRVRRTMASAGLLCVAGAAGLCVSHAAVLGLAAVGLALTGCVLGERDRAAARVVLWVDLLWALLAAGAVVATLRNVSPATQVYLRAYWRDGFMPLGVNGLRWLWSNLVDLFGVTLRYAAPRVFVVVGCLGAMSLWRRRKDVVLLAVMPLLVAFVAAAAHLYPFRGRLTLFLLPSILLLVAEGGEWLRERLTHRWTMAGYAGLLLLVLPAVRAIWRFPPAYRPDDVRPVLAVLRARWQPGDVAYTYFASWQAIAFYAPKYGFGADAFWIGGCHRLEPRAYLRELDRFRGRSRMWVFFTHAVYGERRMLLRYLNAIGIRRDAIPGDLGLSEGKRASAFLYDLSDGRKLGSAAAATFAAVDIEPPADTSIACRHGPEVPSPGARSSNAD